MLWSRIKAQRLLRTAAGNCCKRTAVTSTKPSTIVSGASVDRRRWQVAAAVCLTRYPVISPPLTDLDRDYKLTLETMEFESSLFSRHEIRHQQDRLRAAGQLPTVESDSQRIATAQDMEDAGVAEHRQFVQMRETLSGDVDNDERSLHRLLDKKLIFVMQWKERHSDFWTLPSALWQPDETLFQTAQRALRSFLEISPAPAFFGYAPCKFYKYVHPKPVAAATKSYGTKMFVFKAHLFRNAKVQVNEKAAKDYRWLSKPEVKEILAPNRFRTVVSELIFE